MTGASLIRWSRLEAARRKGARGGWDSTHLRFGVGLLLGAEFCRRLIGGSEMEVAASALSSSGLWLAFALVLAASEVFAGPFRLYWRSDSHILASLPVPGESLWKLAVYRSMRSAAVTGLALAIPLLPLAIWADLEFALRHLIPLGFAAAAGALLGPACALFAGTIVASAKAQALIASMGGEFQAPKTSWLGLLPGIGAAGVALGVLASNAWLRGGTPPGGTVAVLSALVFVPSVALFMIAGKSAKQHLPAAVREIAALDQEILAHVDRSTPSPLERAATMFLNGKASILARKDAALLRRRYPSPYMLMPLGVLALWIVAITEPANSSTWGLALLGGLIAYGVLMTVRSTHAPIEIPSLLSSLPLRANDRFAGKFSLATLRLTTPVALGGIPLVLRSADPLRSGLLVGALLLGGLVSAGLLLHSRVGVEDV